jgi:methylglutamate dehydrogenase subunit C
MTTEPHDLPRSHRDNRNAPVIRTPRPRVGSRLREGSVHFTFDGRAFEGQPGDTVASALLGSGVRLFARSIKYRRPRGVVTAGIEEPNALLTVGAPPNIIPNVPAPVLVLKDGLQLCSQNRWPSLRRDVFACLSLGGRLLSAGFYYKTFKWPSWRAYEPLIRRLAGIGPAPYGSDISQASVEHLHCDVLVIGAGPSGLAAARVCSDAGARVIVCEREPVCGGELEFEGATIDGVSGSRWLSHRVDSLKLQGVRILTETSVVGNAGTLWIAHRYADGLPHDHGVYRIRASVTIIATGAIEHGIVFEDNDRPGVMLLGAAERYLGRHGMVAGQRLLLFGNHERIYAAATRFMAANATVAAIVDTRDSSCIATNRTPLQQAGIPCFAGHAVLRAIGRPVVRGAIVAPLRDISRVCTIGCDGLLVSGGWEPSRLASILEGRAPAVELGSPTAAGSAPTSIVCGAASGRVGLAASLADGHRAGQLAADAARKPQANARIAQAGQTASVASDTAADAREPHGQGDPVPDLLPFWRSPCPAAAEKRQFVDLQNDVTVADLRQALAEGFIDIEHIKRYTTLGIGTEQGGISATVGAAIVSELGSHSDASRVSRARPPIQPVMLATLARYRRGCALRPERRTPLHGWHRANGAVLEPMGLWMRPRHYCTNGVDARAAGIAEAKRVRGHCGLFDGSTLGKIEVVGASAPEFLDRLYLTRIGTLPVGRSRYAVLLREDGIVLDDGLVLRLTPNRFLATVSSSHLDMVLAHMEFWCAAEFGTQDVTITDLTDAWSVIVVAGPASRNALGEVLSADWRTRLAALKHMDFSEGNWDSRVLRVLRASFSGELAFEVHCHPSIALSLWERLSACGVTPYGLEAVDILRLEKGYLVSAEMNGATTPHDLNLDVPAGRNCIGSGLLSRSGFHEPERPRLAGVQSVRPDDAFFGGAQLVLSEQGERPCGYISSAAYSPALGRQVGLALVARRVALGTELFASEPLHGRTTRVRLTVPAHFDAAGERMRS